MNVSRAGLLLMMMSASSVPFTVSAADHYSTKDSDKNVFEYKAPITIDNDKPLQMIVLPESVQSKLHDQNGQDLRVYNSAGEVVPYLVKYEKTALEPAVTKAMAFYPVYSDSNADRINSGQVASGSLKDLEVTIELRLNSLKEQKSLPQAGEITTAAVYIIENPQYIKDEKDPALEKRTLDQLELNWAKGFEGIAPLKLETSADLNHWRTMVANENVADMRFMEQQLHRNTITLHNNVERFIRLTWLTSKRPVVTEMTARFAQQSVKPPYEWSASINMQPVMDSDLKTTVYEFDVSPAFKADKVRFVSSQTNQVYSGDILTRFDDKSHWSRQAGFHFYRIGTNGSEISQLETDLKPSSHEHWRIQFLYPDSSALHNDVTVQVNRYPLTLFFLQRGEGPFYLSFGSHKAPAQSRNISTIVEDLLKQVANDYGLATLGSVEHIKLTGLSSAEAARWKKIILWSVLIVGVLLMLWMAKRLFRQMSESN